MKTLEGFRARFFKAAGMLAFQGAIQKIMGLVSSMILARGLGRESFGAYAAVISVSESAYGFARLGIDAALHVRVAEGPSEERDMLLGAGRLALFFSGSIAAGIVFVLSEWLAESVFGDVNLSGWLKIGALFVVVKCVVQFYYIALVGTHQYSSYSRIMILVSVLNVFVIAAGTLIFGLKGAIFGILLVNVLMAFLLARKFHHLARRLEINMNFRHFTSNVEKLIRLGFPFYASGLIAIPVGLYMQGLLSRSGGIDELAILRIVAGINSILLFLPSSIAASTISLLAEANSDDKVATSEFARYSSLNLRIVWIYCLALLSFLWLIMPWLVELLFGIDYENSIPAVRLGLVVALCLALINAATNAYLATKQLRRIFLQSLCYSSVLLLVGSALIPNMFAYGYVLTELTAYGSVLGVVIVLLLKEIGTQSEESLPIFCLTALSLLFCTGLVATEVYVDGLHQVAINFSLMLLLILMCFKYGLAVDERSYLLSILKTRFPLRAGL
jgi:O-antigen/teichoic acid export membrane protein